MQLPRLWNSATRFSSILLFWAICGFLALIYTLVIVAKLDVSFFEANGLVADPQVRQGFYTQLFAPELSTLGVTLSALTAVALVTFIFGRSQANYFKRAGELMHRLAATGEIGDTRNMGAFSPYLERFLQVMRLRLSGETEQRVRDVIALAVKDWPAEARVHWFDQVQFALGGGALAALFATICHAVFDRLNDRVIWMAGRLVRIPNAANNQFLREQVEITNFVSWTILMGIILAFMYVGYQHGKKMGLSSHSILRDLRRFMEGSYRQRLLLRSGDLGKEYIPRMNKALEKMQAKLSKEDP